jgi:O-acetyl-ADP-ribose deacetylase (regulator of RNase III)
LQWLVRVGDILDVPADVLICSANVSLNLSGGVGGALLLRYGDAMQRHLREMLTATERQFVSQGDLVETPACRTPYRAVLHAVAVDAFYESNEDVVRSLVRRGLQRAAELGARRVALAALATGYGHLPVEEFAQAVLPLTEVEFPPVEQVTICVRRSSDADAMSILADE